MRNSLLILLLSVTTTVFAESSTMTMDMMEQAADIDASSGSMSDAQVVNRISSNFSDFLGEQAPTVVEGLRQGQEFTLTSSYTDSTGTQQTETITIEPPTSKMGYGNVNTTLKLAEYQLAQAGISQPTALELEAALLGGSITAPDGQVVDLQGVLTLRSDGLGWGQIAKQYDTKLGFILGKGNTKTATVSSTPDSLSATSKHTTKIKANTVSQGKGHSFGQGIVSASGASVGGVSAQGNAFGNNKVHSNSRAASVSTGQGIVGAGGASIGHGNAGGHGKAVGHTK